MNNILAYLPGNFSNSYETVFNVVLNCPYLSAEVKSKVRQPEFIQQIVDHIHTCPLNRSVLEAYVNTSTTKEQDDFFKVFANNMVVETYNKKWNPFYRNFYVPTLTDEQKTKFLDSIS
jgi:hypothetical protein